MQQLYAGKFFHLYVEKHEVDRIVTQVFEGVNCISEGTGQVQEWNLGTIGFYNVKRQRLIVDGNTIDFHV
jgi:hypothetical protein